MYKEAQQGSGNYETQKQTAVNRKYKDTLFRMLFSEKDELLRLYNAVNQTQYEDAEELEIVTLENAIYMSMKNDLAFILHDYMNLYEHQSTFNPNMPLRDLFYVAAEYEKVVDENALYSSKVLKIATPRFLVFYNGSKDEPDRRELKLSDSFINRMENPELELKVTMLNINLNRNKELLEHCKTLKDYVEYVATVRRFAQIMPIAEAVERAIDECIAGNVLKDFLIKQRKEVSHVSIFEYDEERVMEIIKRDQKELGREEGLEEGVAKGRAEGIAKGRAEGIAEGRAEGIAKGRAEGIAKGRAEAVIMLLEKHGMLPEDLKNKIIQERDIDTLNQWFMKAMESTSIRDFADAM